MIKVGGTAPSFSLPDQDGKVVSLRDLAGRWVVLYFYPRDDTPGCTIEAKEFSAAAGAFQALGADVFGCSPDSVERHAKFCAKYQLALRLLVDADRKVLQAYGAYGEKLMYGKPVTGVIRSTVLIDPTGKVAHHWATVRAAGHAEQVRARLVELQGGATPIVKLPAKPAAKKAATKKAAATGKAVAKKPAAKKAAPAKAAKKATKPAAKKAGGKSTAKR